MLKLPKGYLFLINEKGIKVITKEGESVCPIDIYFTWDILTKESLNKETFGIPLWKDIQIIIINEIKAFEYCKKNNINQEDYWKNKFQEEFK